MPLTNNKPFRRRNECTIDRRLLSFVPFEVGKPKKSDNLTTATEWNGLYANGVVVANAHSQIDANDIKVLFGVYAVIQNAIEDGTAYRVELPAGKNRILVFGITQKITTLCKSVTGHNNTDYFRSAVMKLSHYTVNFDVKKSTSVCHFITYYVTDKDTKEMTIYINETCLDYLNIHGWILNLETLRRIRSKITTKLYLYLLPQQANCEFLLKTLMGKLTIGGEEKEQKREIKLALDELINKQILLKSYNITNGMVKLVRLRDSKTSVQIANTTHQKSSLQEQ